MGMNWRRWAVLSLAIIATTDPAPGAEPLPADRGVGKRLADFILRDSAGKSVSLYGFRGKKAGVIVFTGVDCPLSNLYMARLAELAKAYEARGVAFLAIDPNTGATAEAVAANAKEHGITFPVLLDPDNRVADTLLAERTCETLVVDGTARLRYRGAIDDQYGLKARKDAPTQNYLVDALAAVLADKDPAVKATPVAGCPIERVKPRAAARDVRRIRTPPPEVVAARADRETPVEVGRVNYAADVAAILQAKCQSCHRPGQVGPFSLLSYDDARRHAATIREVVDDRRMPPWHADPRHGHFANDRSLDARERATLLAWVDQGAPLGDPAAVPAPRAFPEGWTIGTPDVVIEMPETYTVAAQGTLPYQRFRVPTGFTEDKWIQAAEARPGDRSVVHHVIAYLDDHGKSKEAGRHADRHLCGYAPGDMPSVFPAGTAKRIPAGSDLIFEVHYTPNGTIKTDKSSIGLVFAKEPVVHQAFTHGIVQGKFTIPPGAPDYKVESSFTAPADLHLLSFMPHMHLRGKDFRYTAVFPDGTSEVLLSVPAYDFAWQSAYRLAEPRAIPKGTRIDCVAHYDNSSGNPANPDPTKAVKWGDQTFEEMMIGYVDYVEDAPEPAAGAAREPAR